MISTNVVSAIAVSLFLTGVGCNSTSKEEAAPSASGRIPQQVADATPLKTSDVVPATRVAAPPPPPSSTPAVLVTDRAPETDIAPSKRLQPPPDKLTEKPLDREFRLSKQMVDVVAEIESEAGMKAAVPRLRELAKQKNDASKEFSKGKSSEEQILAFEVWQDRNRKEWDDERERESKVVMRVWRVAKKAGENGFLQLHFPSASDAHSAFGLDDGAKDYVTERTFRSIDVGMPSKEVEKKLGMGFEVDKSKAMTVREYRNGYSQSYTSKIVLTFDESQTVVRKQWIVK